MGINRWSEHAYRLANTRARDRQPVTRHAAVSSQIGGACRKRIFAGDRRVHDHVMAGISVSRDRLSNDEVRSRKPVDDLLQELADRASSLITSACTANHWIPGRAAASDPLQQRLRRQVGACGEYSG